MNNWSKLSFQRTRSLNLIIFCKKKTISNIHLNTINFPILLRRVRQNRIEKIYSQLIKWNNSLNLCKWQRCGVRRKHIVHIITYESFFIELKLRIFHMSTINIPQHSRQSRYMQCLHEIQKEKKDAKKVARCKLHREINKKKKNQSNIWSV